MKIVVLGAGAIGCYVGGALASSDADVTLIGRQKLKDEIDEYGLTVVDLEGQQRWIAAEEIRFETAHESLADADIILLSVKSQDTDQSAKLIAQYCRQKAIIVSLQNGVGNVAKLREALPNFEIAGAVVAFNVVSQSGAAFRQGTEGNIIIGEASRTRELAELLERAGIGVDTPADIEPILWGKLAMNLNNALNVISGKPLKQQLMDRNYRRVLALCVEEALACMKTAGIKPGRIGKVDPKIIPFVVRLPNPLFRLVASAMLKIDDHARSSMWEDLQKGRTSEIDYLNGAVVALGNRHNVPTPVNQAIIRLVGKIFDSGKSPMMSGGELLRKAGPAS